MSDSSSVDRWHPSNVEELARKWENEARGALSINRTHIAKKLAAEQVRDLVPELVADRGRVLAAVEKRVEGLRLVPPNVGYGDGWQDYNSAIDDALNAIKSSSSSSTEEREV